MSALGAPVNLRALDARFRLRDCPLCGGEPWRGWDVVPERGTVRLVLMCSTCSFYIDALEIVAVLPVLAESPA